MRVCYRVMRWLFILCLPLLLLSASVGGAVNSLALYHHSFTRYEVSRTTELSEAELDRVAKGLIRYFNSGDEYISLTIVKDDQTFSLFKEHEVIHLRDVKDLFWLDYWIFLGTLVYALVYTGFLILLKGWLQLGRGLVWGSGLTLGLMAVLGLGTMLNFDQLFLQFHLFSFSNEFWQLNPAQDYLIMLFPRGFWYDATVVIVAAAALGAAILGGIGAYLYSSAGRSRG